MTSPAVRVLVVGGSYGGISVALNLLNLGLKRATRFGGNIELPADGPQEVPLDIHIVDERDGYFHVIGAPLAFASNKYAEKFWHRFDDIPALKHPSIRWTQGSVINVDTDALRARIRHTGTNEESTHDYDYLIAASGLRRAFPVVPQSLTRKQYLLETSNHIRAVKESRDGVVVIGGGAVGIEMAGELKVIYPELKVTLVHSRDRLLSAEPLPSECSDLTIEALKNTGVELVLGQRVLETTEEKNQEGRVFQRVKLQNGTELVAGRVIYAISRSIATSSYLPSSALNEEGQVKINNLQRFLDGGRNDERHYAIGDIAAWSAIKRCGGAIAQGTIAAENIYRQILQERYGIVPKFAELPKYPPVIALAVGKAVMVYAAELGASCSEENMPIYFRDDLGFQQTWDHMRMSESW